MPSLPRLPGIGCVLTPRLSPRPPRLVAGNYALSDTLVIVTVNSGPSPSSSVNAEGQQIDVEIVDASHHNNVYLDKKDIRGETRMAINTHSQSDLGVCITNRLKKGAYSAIACGRRDGV